MKHTHPFRAIFARSLMVVGGVLGLGALLSVPAAATNHDDAATNTWTANFQVVNSTPAAPKGWTVTLAAGCRGAASETEVARGATLDVSCTVDSEWADLAYTVEWTTSIPKKNQVGVEEYDGTASHSCERDEIARVTFTNVGRPPLNPAVTRSTECVETSTPDDDDPT